MSGLVIVFVAIGESYVREACRAAATCRRAVPGCRTLLYTDASLQDPAIDSVMPIAHAGENPLLMKIRGIRAVREERFVFLDTDTYVVADISELGQLLDDFDIAAVHARVRLRSNIRPETKVLLSDVPACFPEYNTGVIAARRSPALDAMLGRWEDLFAAQIRQPLLPRSHDQPSFRRALYESRLRLATLPTEYNCRFNHPATVCGAVKILHGRGSPRLLDRVAARVNQRLDYRLIFQQGRPPNVVPLPAADPAATPAHGTASPQAGPRPRRGRHPQMREEE